MQCCIQGQFKEEVAFSDVMTGQCFSRPFSNLPQKWLLKLGISIIKKLSPAFEEDILGPAPFMLSPLVATAQAFAIHDEGKGEEEVDVRGGEFEDDLSLLHPSFQGLTAPQRKKLFSSPQELGKYSFVPGFMYSFDFYEHLFNPSTFEFDLGFTHIDLAPYLDHQPIQIMATRKSTNQPLWCFELFHEKLVPLEEEEGQMWLDESCSSTHNGKSKHD